MKHIDGPDLIGTHRTALPQAAELVQRMRRADWWLTVKAGIIHSAKPGASSVKVKLPVETDVHRRTLLMTVRTGLYVQELFLQLKESDMQRLPEVLQNLQTIISETLRGWLVQVQGLEQSDDARGTPGTTGSKAKRAKKWEAELRKKKLPWEQFLEQSEREDAEEPAYTLEDPPKKDEPKRGDGLFGKLYAEAKQKASEKKD